MEYSASNYDLPSPGSTPSTSTSDSPPHLRAGAHRHQQVALQPAHQTPPLSLNVHGLGVSSHSPASPASGMSLKEEEMMSIEPSPVDRDDGSGSEGRYSLASASGGLSHGSVGPAKSIPTNNFVTKLYQMINDPKSAAYIAWTQLGTSFVVSSVGEFSRTILGSHFKHNNFSSFVRQLNMYGFHKINRTPRSQRSSSDGQTWEFSHHKFLRGRPDLLDEIKRKALEPDLSTKQRIELPGEVQAQLNAMRDENRRLWEVVHSERRRVERVHRLLYRLSETMGVSLEALEDSPPSSTTAPSPNPNIYMSSNTWEHPQMPERKRPRIDTSGMSNAPSGDISPIPHISSHQSPMPTHHMPQIPTSHSTMNSPLEPPNKRYTRSRSDSAPIHHQHHQSEHPYSYSPYEWGGMERPRSGMNMSSYANMGMQGGIVNISGHNQA